MTLYVLDQCHECDRPIRGGVFCDDCLLIADVLTAATAAPVPEAPRLVRHLRVVRPGVAISAIGSTAPPTPLRSAAIDGAPTAPLAKKNAELRSSASTAPGAPTSPAA